MSAKYAAKYRKYLEAKKRFMGNYRFCEMHPMCLNRATDVHHIRGRLGDYLLDQRYWRAVCPACHAWIHNNGKKARELGLLQ